MEVQTLWADAIQDVRVLDGRRGRRRALAPVADGTGEKLPENPGSREPCFELVSVGREVVSVAWTEGSTVELEGLGWIGGGRGGPYRGAGSDTGPSEPGLRLPRDRPWVVTVSRGSTVWRIASIEPPARPRRLPPADWRPVAAVGLSLAVQGLCLLYALDYVPAPSLCTCFVTWPETHPYGARPAERPLPPVLEPWIPTEALEHWEEAGDGIPDPMPGSMLGRGPRACSEARAAACRPPRCRTADPEASLAQLLGIPPSGYSRSGSGPCPRRIGFPTPYPGMPEGPCPETAHQPDRPPLACLGLMPHRAPSEM